MFTVIDPKTGWYLTFGAFTVAMIVGTIWAYRVWRDVKGETDDDTGDPEDLLTPLAQAYVAGQMSEEEYQRIKASVLRTASTVERPAASGHSKAVGSIQRAVSDTPTDPGRAEEHSPEVSE